MGKRILIAEDNKEVQDVLTGILGEEYDIKIVSTPNEAVNYTGAFDLLLTDFTFYDKDGRKIKEQGLDIIERWAEKKKGLSAILMSSGLNPNIIRAAREMGARTFAKYQNGKTPIDEEGLRKIIEEYLRN